MEPQRLAAWGPPLEPRLALRRWRPGRQLAAHPRRDEQLELRSAYVGGSFRRWSTRRQLGRSATGWQLGWPTAERRLELDQSAANESVTAHQRKPRAGRGFAITASECDLPPPQSLGR